jgi:hypothetical protein
MVKNKVKEYSYHQINQCMKENSKIIKFMEKEFIDGKME